MPIKCLLSSPGLNLAGKWQPCCLTVFAYGIEEAMHEAAKADYRYELRVENGTLTLRLIPAEKEAAHAG